MTLPTVVTEGGLIIVDCVLRWIYGLISQVITLLKALLTMLITMIDAVIAQIRAILAMLDPIALLNTYIIEPIEALIQQLIAQLLGLFNQYGPGADLCPELYHYVVDPINAYIQAFFAAFVPYKEYALNTFSLVALFDSLLVYWQDTKYFLQALLTIMDDAIYQALVVEGTDNL
jgi:hypothetical protein